MPPLVEGQHTGEFLVSEANGTLSREVGTLSTRAAKYLDGTILGLSGDDLIALDSGTEVIAAADVVGVLYGNYDASAGPVEAVYIARLAEVKDDLINIDDFETGDVDDVRAGLTALFIRTR